MIQPETHVIEKDGTEWKKFASIVPPPAHTDTEPAPANTPPISAPLHAKETSADGPTSYSDPKSTARAGVALVILVTVIVLWHYAPPLLYLAGFLGTWIAAACLGLKAKQSKILSIGGGFVAAIIALALALKVTGAGQNVSEGASSTARFEGIKKEEYKRWLDLGREHAEKLIALWKQLERNQPSNADGDRLLTELLDHGKTLYADYQKWRGTIREREAGISNPLEDKILHVFELSSNGPAEAGYTWTSQNEMTGNPYLIHRHKFSVETLDRLASSVEEAQKEFDAQTR